MKENRPAPIFNKPQLVLNTQLAKTSANIWGRGTGKSYEIGWIIKLIVENMPRSSWIILGATFKQLLSRTLPGTINALEQLGYKKDYHYFIGKKAPKAWKINGYWEEPYEAPVNYNNFMHFYTGAGFHLESQDSGATSSRGLNIDGIINDEALLTDWEKYTKDLIPTNRGNLSRPFAKHPLHHAKIFFSSMPYANQADWLMEYGNYYLKLGIDIFKLRERVIDLQVEFLNASTKKEKLEIWKDITALNKKVHYFKHYQKDEKGDIEELFYSEANAFDNILNLGLKYIKDAYRDLPSFIFDVEMLNRRIRNPGNSFYPLLNYNKHTYIPKSVEKSIEGLELKGNVDSSNDEDCNKKQKLIIAIDWGNKICCMTIAQDSVITYRIINELYVLPPGLVKELAQEFIKYYTPHDKKEVDYIVDQWGSAFKDPSNKKTYNETFVDELTDAGWKVNSINLGKIAHHQDRYLFWQYALSGTDSRYPSFEWNRYNCKYCLLAMDQAKTKEGMKGEIKKDKKDERNESADQRGTTHFTDTIDLHGMYKKKTFMQSYGKGFVDTHLP